MKTVSYIKTPVWGFYHILLSLIIFSVLSKYKLSGSLFFFELLLKICSLSSNVTISTFYFFSWSCVYTFHNMAVFFRTSWGIVVTLRCDLLQCSCAHLYITTEHLLPGFSLLPCHTQGGILTLCSHYIDQETKGKVAPHSSAWGLFSTIGRFILATTDPWPLSMVQAGHFLRTSGPQTSMGEKAAFPPAQCWTLSPCPYLLRATASCLVCLLYSRVCSGSHHTWVMEVQR